MGIKTRDKVLWKETRVSELIKIAQESTRRDKAHNELKAIRIDFDVYSLAHTLYRSSKIINVEYTVIDGWMDQ